MTPRTADIEAAGTCIGIGDIADAVFATDLSNRITAWEPSAERLFGYAAAEAIGRSFGVLLPFRMRKAADEDEFFATIRAGRTWRGQGTVRLRDGSELWIESTVKPKFVDGRLIGSVSVSRDMTHAIEAERYLIAQERFVDGVLDAAGALVIVMDAAGSIVRFNAACEQLSGYRAAEVIGHPSWELLPEDDRAASVNAFANLRASDFPNSSSSRWRRRDGQVRVIVWSASCLTDESGTLRYVVTTGIDVTDQQRADAALRGIEAVGQLLASDGPTPAALTAVLDVLADQLGYGHLTLLLADKDRLRVGATRGYIDLPASFPATGGIVGRVYRTGEAAWVPDVTRDPDYRRTSPDVRSEIAVPLRSATAVIGVLDIEADEDLPLSENDFRLAQTVAERVGNAILLGREQQALAERARLFAGLSEFARVTNAILEPERLWPALIAALTEIFPGDVTTLTVLAADGRYYLRAARGVPESSIGSEVRPGDGPAGRAIRNRTFFGPARLSRDQYASFLRDLIPLDSLTSVAVPLIRDEAVLGAISVGRVDSDEPFSELECEIMSLLGAQAALALANAQLHEEVSQLAIHDGLTGLYNRRHCDATLDLILARWRRMGAAGPLAAIMFDLDHFGRFNKDHGHQAGDAVLRSFAGLLRERLRSSDLVARYGGEEFVVILEGCTLAEAVRIADEVRAGLEARSIAGPQGQLLHARVSAGCAVLDPADPTKEALLRAADVGLFMAKRGGRNQVVAA